MIARARPVRPSRFLHPGLPPRRADPARFRLLAVALLGAGLLGGCGAGPAVPAASDAARAAASLRVGTALAEDQVLDRALSGSPDSLDPQLATSVPASHVLDDLFEGLTTTGIDGSVQPGVASSWQQSADGLTWTFHLRPDARWSNGAPVTAQDFVYAWRREVDPKTAAQYAQYLEPIVNALAIASGKKPVDSLGIEAPDAHTFIVHLNAPTPFLLRLLDFNITYPVYPPAIRRWGPAWVRPGHLVSNGAFVLTSNVLHSRITLAKNPYYWDAQQVHLTRVTYYPMDDVGQMVLRYLAGDVQFTEAFPPTERAFLERRLGKDQVVVAPYLGTAMLGFSFLMPPFRHNRALRAALTLSIDRRAMSRYLGLGMSPPAFTLMPPLPGYDAPVPAWARLGRAQREALARRYYHEAGYSDAHPLQVDLYTSISGPQAMYGLEDMTATWHAVLGADVHIHEEDFKVLIQDQALQKLPLFWNAWIGDYPDPVDFMQLFQGGNGQNHSGYSNPQFDALLAQAARERDNARRYRLFERAESILNRDFAYLPIAYYTSAHLIKPYLKGWHTNIADRMLSRYMYVLQHQGA